MERTLIIFKPDAVQRNLCGQILDRFEKKGLQIVGMKFIKISPSLAETHYGPHKGKPFYDGLVKFMTSSPVVVLALEGKDAIGIAVPSRWPHRLVRRPPSSSTAAPKSGKAISSHDSFSAPAAGTVFTDPAATVAARAWAPSVPVNVVIPSAQYFSRLASSTDADLRAR